jgi:hypothetical protein
MGLKKAWIILLFAAMAGLAMAEEVSDLAEPPSDALNGEIPSAPTRRFEFTPQVSVVAISALNIPTPGYQIDYIPTIEGLPTVQLIIGRPLAEMGRFTLSAHGSVGYGARSGAFTTLSGNNTRAPQNITLRWIPLNASLRLAYRPSTFPYLRPSLGVGFGSLILMQSGDNPALSRTLGIPMLVLSPQLTFMDGGSRHWLGGFSFGLSLIRGLAGDSSLAATSLDLSLNILL